MTRPGIDEIIRVWERANARWGRTPTPDNLDDCIAVLLDMAVLAPVGHLVRSIARYNLGGAFLDRHGLNGELSNVLAAVIVRRDVVDVTPRDDPLLPNRLSGLGKSLVALMNATGDPDAGVAAVAAYEEALRLTGPNDPNRPHALADLGSMLLATHPSEGDIDGLTRAIALLEEALGLSFKHDSDRLLCVQQLARAILLRFAEHRDPADLEWALETFDTAFTGLDANNAERRFNSGYLGNELVTVYLRTGHLPFRVLPTADSEPVVYRITAGTPGEKTLRVDLRQAGVVVGGVTFTITVGASTGRAPAPGATATVITPRPTRSVTLGGSHVPPPDLDLRVHLVHQGGRCVLRYVLHSPNNAVDHHHQPVGDVVLTGSPEEYRARLMRRIEGLPPDAVADKLRAFGERLYRELLPAQLRAAYRQFRAVAVVRSFHVTSDEPWIPWELVRPYEDGPVPVDDDFWAARFDFARWLAGDVGPATRIHVRRLVCVEASRPPGLGALPAAAAERRNVAALAADCGIDDASPSYADAPTMARLLLDPKVDLWHVAAHGDVDERHPDESALILADGSVLSPEDLFGARQSAIRSGRPMVFLNACRIAQQGWSLVQLGGWVDAWVRRCRSGAFIGPLWSVSDAPAEMFASVVYDRLRDGHSLGASVRAARTAVRSQWPDNPTWLAYALYAHPNLRVVLGRRTDPAPTPQAGRE